MKTYQEQNYPATIRVLVFMQDASGYPVKWIDHIKGLNTGHALYLARINWLDAWDIEVY